MRELNAKNDAVVSLRAQRSDQGATMEFAEAHLRNTEVAVQTESKQRELAMAMAHEIATGQAAVVQQFEQQYDGEKVEQTVEVDRMNSVTISVDRAVEHSEIMLRASDLKSEEYAKLLFWLSFVCV